MKQRTPDEKSSGVRCFIDFLCDFRLLLRRDDLPVDFQCVGGKCGSGEVFVCQFYGLP